MSLNLTGAARSAVVQFVSNLKGQPASVRERVARVLRETDPGTVAEQFRLGRQQIEAGTRLKKALLQALSVGGSTAAITSN